jgi:hypothetical protein
VRQTATTNAAGSIMKIVKICLVLAAIAAASRIAFGQPKVEERIVGRAAPRTEAYMVSPKGVHYAVLTPKGTRNAMVVDGVEGPEFDTFLNRRGHIGTVANNGVVFSPDGSRHAYFAALGTQYIFVVDGKEMARGELGPSNLGYSDMTFSPGSKHVYFVDLKVEGVRGRAQLVMDGKAGPPSGHQNIFPVFSPDETHWAYNAIKFGGRPDENISVVDGKEVPFIGFNPVYTADNRLLTALQNRPSDPAVVAINGKPAVNGVSIGGKIGPAPSGLRWAGVMQPKKPGDPNVLYIDGKEVPEAQNVDEVIFSPDGSRYMALCRNNATHTRYVVVDGKKGPEYQAIAANSARFSPDSARAIYIANNLGKNFVVADGQPSAGYLLILGQVAPIALSQKGGHYGYVASDGVAQTLIIDGKAVPAAGFIVMDSLGFSPDGTRYAYAANRGGRGVRPAMVLVVGGQEIPGITLNETALPNIPATREWWLRTAGFQSRYYAFSPDSKHIAFCGARATDNRNTLFVDGKALLPSIGLNYLSFINWTPDSKHLFWLSGEKGTDRPQPYSRVVLDGAPTSVKLSYEEMPSSPGPWEVGADGTLQILRFDGPTAKRYRIAPGSGTSIETALAAAK